MKKAKIILLGASLCCGALAMSSALADTPNIPVTLTAVQGGTINLNFPHKGTPICQYHQPGMGPYAACLPAMFQLSGNKAVLSAPAGDASKVTDFYISYASLRPNTNPGEGSYCNIGSDQQGLATWGAFKEAGKTGAVCNGSATSTGRTVLTSGQSYTVGY